MAMAYNVNDTATQILAAKQVKENIFMDLVHKNGYGVTQHEETNASSIRIFKVKPSEDSARELGDGSKNAAWFNSDGAGYAKVVEYDLNLLYVFDKPVDIPEVQQDMVSVNLMDNATKNIGGRCALEINASTLAAQLVAAKENTPIKVGSGTYAAYQAVQDASTKLDDGDEANGIQSFPFAEREIILRPSFRASLLNEKGVIRGGSNYAQSMLAKGAVSPEATKEWGNMYCGEIDGIPCYIAPAQLWKRAAAWSTVTSSGNTVAASESVYDKVNAIVCAASATDRGISSQDYIKIIDSPNGAGKRLQPKTRWGINVCYKAGIVPILASDGSLTATGVRVPGYVAQS
jgi:hypothetical protein